MTNPTLERAARAAYEAYEASWEGDELKCWDAVARAVLMAVLPTLERYDSDSDGYGWCGMSYEEFGDYVRYADLQAILNDGEGE